MEKKLLTNNTTQDTQDKIWDIQRISYFSPRSTSMVVVLELSLCTTPTTAIKKPGESSLFPSALVLPQVSKLNTGN